jgi:putative endonuclease
MASSRRALGADGERRAARWLERSGYRVLARNVRAGGVELDLVVARGALVVFVEVKTRRTALHGPPELAVDVRKQRRLWRGAAAWLREHGGGFARARFDVVSCETDGAGGWRIRHLPGALRGD